MKNNTREIISYIIFGVLTTAVSWITYTLCVNLCNFSVFISNIISWIFSVSFAFVTNKLFVFKFTIALITFLQIFPFISIIA